MIERVGDFRNTDFSVQFLMNNLVDFFSDKGNWKPAFRPYVIATLKLGAKYADLFRRNGYSFDGIKFSQHKRDKKGKLISVVADFGKIVPTDKEIKEHIETIEKLTNE